MTTPADRYAAFRDRQSDPGTRRLPRALRFRLRRLPGRRLPRARRGPWRAGGRADRLGQDGDRRVRRAPGAGPGAQVLLHHADQGAVQPEVRRPGAPLRQPHGGPAHRGQQHQRRRPGGGHDHRGAPQHAVHRLAGPVRARLRRPRRGALPGGQVPRRGLGRSDHPPARIGAGGRAVRDGEQRRGVRRVAGPGPRRHGGHRGRAAAGPAVAARAGREPAVRPVHRHGARGRPGRRGAPAGQPRTAPGRPAGHLDRAQGPAPARPGRPAARAGSRRPTGPT